jgi:hypothetical protein
MKRKIGNIKRPSRAAGYVNSGRGSAWRANRVCLTIGLLALHQITTYFCVMQKRYNFGSVVSIPLFFSERNGARGFGRRPSYVPYGSMRWTRRVRGTEDLAGDDVDPAAHRHCQEIYLTGSNGSNPSGRDRRKPASRRRSTRPSRGRSNVRSTPNNRLTLAIMSIDARLPGPP